jgi:cytochrome c-type biogenesis protein CcmH
LLKPRLEPHTWLLWLLWLLSLRSLLPPLALAGGGVTLWINSRRRSKSADAEDQSRLKLTADEEARLERLMSAEQSSDKPV